MKTISKKKFKTFTSEVYALINSFGGINGGLTPVGESPIYTTENILVSMNNSTFLLNTKAGLLSLTINTMNDSAVYSVFGKFDNLELASKVVVSDRLNRYSGKFNFHYTDLDTLLDELYNELSELVDDTTVFTNIADLIPLEGCYDDNFIFTFDGIAVRANRICIDRANRADCKNFRNKMTVTIDATTYIISKRSKFQLIFNKTAFNTK